MAFDELVAAVAEKVSAEEISAAARVAEHLEEDKLSFGPVVMFALDSK